VSSGNKLLRAFAGREEEMLARISHMYYIKRMTQRQIAGEFGVSRFKILRLLEEARNKSIVRIEILSPQGACLDLEKRLKNVGLNDAIVAVPFEDTPFSRLNAVCQSAASYLFYKTPGKKCFGITWGKAVANALSALAKLSPDKQEDLTVTPLMGGMGKQQFNISSTNLVSEVARLYGAQAHFILSPCLVETAEVRDYLVSEVNNAHTLEYSKKADIAIMGIGFNGDNSGLVQSGLLSREEMDELIKAGGVGHIGAHFYDIRGDECEVGKGRVVGLTLEEIKKLPLKIAVASGLERVDPIIGAIHGKLIDTLITDKTTAEALLEKMEKA
jgi:deoxyribonucleoside regulator